MNDWSEILDIPVGMAVLDIIEDKAHFNTVNEEFGRLTGYTGSRLLQMEVGKMIFADDQVRYSNALCTALKGQENAECEVRIYTSNDIYKWVTIRFAGHFIKNTRSRILMIAIDTDDRKQLELQLELLNHQYEVMEQVSDEIPFDYDIESNKLLRSYRIMQMRGEKECSDEYYDFDEEVKNFHPLDREILVSAMKEAVNQKITASIEVRYNMAKHGLTPHYVWLRILYKSIVNSKGKIARIIGRSHNVERDMRLQDRVRRDPLTKLLNKVEVQIEVDKTLEKYPNDTHVMFVIDIDNFKSINDTFGHTFGDTVISDVAGDIRSQFRGNDIIGRVGGDEFLVFMKKVDAQKAAIKARNLCNTLAKEYSGDDVVRCITTSIGLAVSGIDGDTYEELFEKADHAMYRAKKSGKNGFRVAEEEDVGPLERSEHAAENRGQLEGRDRDFLAFAINILSHARNIDGSLNLLLEQMLSKYRLDEITVCEEMADGKNFLLTNSSGEIEFFSKMVFPAQGLKDKLNYTDNIKQFDDRYLHGWQSVSAKQGVKIPAEYIDRANILIGKFETSNGRCGMCCFYAFDKERKWSENELNILGELTRIIGVFVSLRTRIDESNALLRNIQNRDILTGLLNLDPFKSEYNKALEEYKGKSMMCLVYFDLNNFGYINENYGYQIGDKVLKYLAHDIKETDGAIIACRLYSDFFILLVRGKSKETIKESVLSRQKHFVNLHNHQYPSCGIGITSGMYFIEEENTDPDVAIENANLAWKKAKRSRGGKYRVFGNRLREERSEEQHIVGEFYEALYRGDFLMYLQPKFNIITGEVYGAEALARWEKPNGLVIPPVKFIDLLERIGYITELDFYIFEQLLKTFTKWKQQHKRDIVISVNFSGKHFELEGKEFVRRINSIMNKYPVKPSQIEIEITESIMIKNHDALSSTLNKLRSMGFRVAIDDFGTGYSSLSVLTNIPADVIKIDKSFLEKEMSEQNADILKCIGELVKISGREIIFEGVETVEQERFLKECGFEYAQGYLCNRPLTVSEFEKMYL